MSSPVITTNLLLSGQVGPTTLSDGQFSTERMSRDRTQVTQQGHARYTEANYRNGLFSLGVTTAAAITAYIGAAGGTPQVAIWNPAGSGKIGFITHASFGNVVAASAAGTANWTIYYGPTAAITQATLSTPVNQLSASASGSVMKGYTNAALTSSTALTNMVALGYYYWATAAAATSQAGLFELAGAIAVYPGNMAALGGSAALTSATWVGSLIWEEIAV